MPARGYQYYEVVSFPDWDETGHVFQTEYQGVIFSDMFDEGPRSTITTLGVADHPEFRKYHVRHETHESVCGRYMNAPIEGYVAQYDFHAFHHVETRQLLMDGTKRLCRELVQRLTQQTSSGFLIVEHQVDLQRLAADLRADVRGGWFGNLRIADVSTIGLYGATVGESAEWDRYERVGDVTVLDVCLQPDLIVKIMANRGVVVYKHMTEREALQFLLVFQKTLDGYDNTTHAAH